MDGRKIRVMIVDDQPQALEEVQKLVERMPGISIAATARNGQEAVKLAERCRPDVILIDLRTPVMAGITTTQHITARGLQARIIALTSFEDDQTFHKSLRAGVTGFILKTSSPGEIAHAIQQVYLGESMLSPKLISRVLSRYEPGLPLSDIVTALTEKEIHLLTLVGQGLNNTEIAENMHLSKSTVKSYISRLMPKLQVQSRAQMVIIAFQNGLVTL